MSNIVWRVEAFFSHINGPVDMGSGTDKRVAHARVADAIMSENVQRIVVYRDDVLSLTFTVEAMDGPDTLIKENKMSNNFTLRCASTWLFVWMCSGFIVAIASWMLLRNIAMHLPGGSLSVGMFGGYYVAMQYKLRSGVALMVVLGYAFVGVIGWLCALPFMH